MVLCTCYIALVVQRIEHRTSKPVIEVRFLAGAQGRKSKEVCFFAHLRQAERCFAIAKPRAGVAKVANDGEQLFVTARVRARLAQLVEQSLYTGKVGGPSPSPRTRKRYIVKI